MHANVDGLLDSKKREGKRRSKREGHGSKISAISLPLLRKSIWAHGYFHSFQSTEGGWYPTSPTRAKAADNRNMLLIYSRHF